MKEQFDWYLSIAIITGPLTIAIVGISIVFWLMRPRRGDKTRAFKDKGDHDT